jgi:cyclase
VKTIRFKNPKYIGDPINAVKIFNEKEVDELVFLDITASKERREPNYKLISEITSECFMPLGYGGGIQNEHQIAKLLAIGVEKIVINTRATDRRFLEAAVKTFGSSTIVASMDVKKAFLTGKQYVYTNSGSLKIQVDPVTYAKGLEDSGVGELFVTSIDQDGLMSGYDLELLTKITKQVSVPVVISGGAGSFADFKNAVQAGASAVAAGSLFVFKGPNRAVLINYPSQKELSAIFNN